MDVFESLVGRDTLEMGSRLGEDFVDALRSWWRREVIFMGHFASDLDVYFVCFGVSRSKSSSSVVECSGVSIVEVWELRHWGDFSFGRHARRDKRILRISDSRVTANINTSNSFLL